jgi:positive regulator of sigma E activity
MEETGIVIEGGRGVARVRIERSPSCAGCRLCVSAGDGPHMIARAVDPHGTAPGDRVRISTRTAAPLAAALVLFGIPLLLLFAGYAAGAAAARAAGLPPQGLGVAGAALCFAASFLLIAVVNRRLPGRGRSVIVEVLGPA